MLSADLLKTNVRGDRITPAFVEPEGDILALAEDVIRAFGDHTGKKLGELMGILEEMEDQGFDYRLVRGLVALLERRCDLAVASAIAPESVRREVFSIAGRPALDEETRSGVIAKAAMSLGISPGDVEASLFADLESELIVSDFNPPSPQTLLEEYNLSLAQTLLFKAIEMSFRASSKHKEVLRAVKRLGLMYSASHEGGRLDIAVGGPVSAIKATERYGTSLAKLLPFIVASPGWSVEASILRKDFNGNPRIYKFAMDERTHGRLFGGAIEAEAEAIEFDSEPEERFYNSFKNAATGWDIVREPEPLVAGRYLYIPDFLLEKDGTKVYVEIAGFWTAEYLKRKVAKLGELKDTGLIVLASTKMACDAFKSIVGNVILYDKKIPLKEILDRLRAYDEKNIVRELERLKETGLSLDGDVISINGLSAKSGISPEAIKRYLENSGTPGYVLAGNELLSSCVVETLKNLMPSAMQYEEASTLLRSRGIMAVDPALKLLGYTVRWSGLDPGNAIVTKAEKKATPG